MSITGEVECGGRLVVDGSLHGSLSGSHLVITETGRLEGEITADAIECYGMITGHVVTRSLDLKSSGSQAGTVVTCELLVEQGAVLDCALQCGPARYLGSGSSKE